MRTSEEAEEARFRATTTKSVRAVKAFATYLRGRGMEVEVRVPTIRPTFEERDEYGDTEDLRARRPEGDWLRFEIKGREFVFTGRRDFKYQGGIAAERVTKKSPPADWYVTLSQDLRCAAVMDGKRIGEWPIRTLFDTTKGYPSTVYLCPLVQARFVRL